MEQQAFEEEEGDFELRMREPAVVAKRILALLAVIGKVHQGNDARFLEWLDKHDIRKYLSKKEALFLKTESPDRSSMINFSWRQKH